MIYFQGRVAFQGKHCTNSDCTLASLRTLARGVGDGSIYRLLIDLVALVHARGKLGELSSFEEAFVGNV